MHIFKDVKRFLLALLPLTIIASSAWAIDKLTLRSGTGDETVIQLKGSPSVQLSFQDDELILEFPTMDFRVKCLGDITAEGYCYLSAMATVDDSVDYFSVGGSVSGLASGQSVVLRNNGGDDLTVSASGNFAFATTIVSGGAYNVSVAIQPNGQTCSVSAGTGIAVANVTNVSVSCSSTAFTIGGSVSGLGSGKRVELRNNGGDSLGVTANGAFTFASSVASGSAYAVTVGTQPDGQTCSVRNGSGTAAANVSNVSVSCTDNTVTFAVCQDVPNNVVCDPALPELLEGSVGQITISVPANKILSVPSVLKDSTTANGRLTYYSVDYTPIGEGYYWKYWYSSTPGGPIINTDLGDPNMRCQDQRHPENTYYWSQNPADYQTKCYLGKEASVVYLNWAYLDESDVLYTKSGSFKVSIKLTSP